ELEGRPGKPGLGAGDDADHHGFDRQQPGEPDDDGEDRRPHEEADGQAEEAEPDDGQGQVAEGPEQVADAGGGEPCADRDVPGVGGHDGDDHGDGGGDGQGDQHEGDDAGQLAGQQDDPAGLADEELPEGAEAVLRGHLGGGDAEGDYAEEDGGPVQAVDQAAGLGQLGQAGQPVATAAVGPGLGEQQDHEQGGGRGEAAERGQEEGGPAELDPLAAERRPGHASHATAPVTPRPPGRHR